MNKEIKELKRIHKAPRKIQRDYAEGLEHNSVAEAEEFSRGFESSLRH